MMRRAWMLIACVASVTFAQACGPDFFPDVFVRTARPDVPARYVAGHLGLLQTGFPSADLFVAYRYLNGGTLSPAEQEGWSPTYPTSEQDYGGRLSNRPDESPSPEPMWTAWTTLRAQYPGDPAAPTPDLKEKITTAQGYVYYNDLPNCAPDAFRTAVETLQNRAARWGRNSPPMLDWLKGQDAVFAACSAPALPPQPAPDDSPILLRQDRAYQVAAFHFYSRDFDEAEREFLSISADHLSPWKTTAGYVAGRVLIRKAFMSVTDAQAPADYEPTAMQAAGQQLRSFLATNPPEPWRHAAQAQLALVRIRLEPEARTQELATLLAGPAEDPNYARDVKDTLWIMEYRVSDDLRADVDTWEFTKGADGSMKARQLTSTEAEEQAAAKRNKAFDESTALRQAAPILDWTITLRAKSPLNAEHALTRWRRTRSLPWLVAAMMLTPDTAVPDAALLQAAEAVPQESPAWETVAYQKSRLQLNAGKIEEARNTLVVLQAALDRMPTSEREPSSLNAVRGLEMRAALNRSALVSHLPRQMLLAASETTESSTECAEVMKHRGDWHHCIQPGTEELDTDGARLLNEQAPLSVWIEAAHSQSVPQPLREAIAMQGWTRATLLGDTASAATLKPLLPNPLRHELASSSPLTPWVALARNPGLQPSLDRGTQRAYSYDFVQSYQLNWCYKSADYLTPAQTVATLSPEEVRRGSAQAYKAQPLRSVDVGRHIIAAIRSNPSDPAAPEALYLVLRMIRYGCNPVKEPGTLLDGTVSDLGPDQQTGERLLALRRETGELMRRYYASSPWTRKAAPFVGEVHPPSGH